jgi:hypothetical protein
VRTVFVVAYSGRVGYLRHRVDGHPIDQLYKAVLAINVNTPHLFAFPWFHLVYHCVRSELLFHLFAFQYRTKPTKKANAKKQPRYNTVINRTAKQYLIATPLALRR